MLPRHPTARLVCWLLIVLTIQEMPILALPSAGVLFVICFPEAMPRWRRLAYRTRWLLLSLLVILSVSVAGTPFWDSLPAGPTREGLEAASVQCGRLLLVLAAVAALLEATPLPVLMAGCHGLLRPLDRLGLNSDRAVARLSLTLHYAESLPRPSDWRALLQPIHEGTAGNGVHDKDHRVLMPQAALKPGDLFALALAALALLVAVGGPWSS